MSVMSADIAVKSSAIEIANFNLGCLVLSGKFKLSVTITYKHTKTHQKNVHDVKE